MSLHLVSGTKDLFYGSVLELFMHSYLLLIYSLLCWFIKLLICAALLYIIGCLFCSWFFQQADPRFLWNNYLLEVLIDNKVINYWSLCWWVFSTLEWPILRIYVIAFCSLIHTCFQSSKEISFQTVCLLFIHLLLFILHKITVYCKFWFSFLHIYMYILVFFPLTDHHAFTIFKQPLEKILLMLL